MSDIDIRAQGDLTIGEFVGRDKIVNNIQTIYQRALTAFEVASGERSLEIQLLAQGVSAYTQRLQAIANDRGWRFGMRRTFPWPKRQLMRA